MKWIFLLLLTATTGLQAASAPMYVKAPSVSVKSSTAANATILADLPQGTEVFVINTKGKWVQARVGSITGWIYKFKLTTERPAKTSQLLAGLGRGHVSAREGSTASSIRGLSPTSEKYAGRVRIQPQHIAMVKHMESVKIDKAEIQKFLQEGRLGEYSEVP